MCYLCNVGESCGKSGACGVQSCMTTTETFNWDGLAGWLRGADWYYMFADESPAGVRTSTIAQDLWAIAHSIDPQRAIDVWESNFPEHVRRDPIIGSGHTIANWIADATRNLPRMSREHRDYVLLHNK